MDLERHLRAVGGATTTTDLRAVGLDDHGIRRAVASGALVRVRKGAFVAPVNDDPFGTEHHRRRAVAICRSSPGLALCHESAALVAGLPVLRVPELVQTVRIEGAGSRTRGGVSVRPAVDRRLLVGGPREWADVLLVRPTAAALQLVARGGADALVVADAALAAGATPADLRRDAGLLPTPRNPSRAAAVLALASGLSESPGESRCRWLFHELGIEQPEQQVTIRAGGRFVARVDFLFRRQLTVVEFDGRVKYEGDALWREKRRELELIRAGYRVVRLTWADLANPRAVLRLISPPLAA